MVDRIAGKNREARTAIILGKSNEKLLILRFAASTLLHGAKTESHLTTQAHNNLLLTRSDEWIKNKSAQMPPIIIIELRNATDHVDREWYCMKEE